jgi:hypothetical protein
VFLLIFLLFNENNIILRNSPFFLKSQHQTAGKSFSEQNKALEKHRSKREEADET